MIGKRLEQAAAPGEILIGGRRTGSSRTPWSSSRSTARAEGEAEPHCRVPPASVARGAPRPRRDDARLVGRERERRLRTGLGARRRRARCELFTVVGVAGVGKSRLAAEFPRLGRRDRRARPMPAVRRRDHLLAGGRGGRSSSRAAARPRRGGRDPLASRRVEAPARRRTRSPGRSASCSTPQQAPLVVVFDDIHWAEETFLELVEQLALLSARRADPAALPRPAGAARAPRRRGRSPLRLEPLEADEDVDELLRTCDRRRRSATGSAARPAGTRCSSRRCSRCAGERGGRGRRPADAPGAARAPASTSSTRRSVACSSAARSRARSSTAAPSRRSRPDETADHCRGWPRSSASELIRPDRPQLAGEDAFRFRHLLIRDAAYDALPKATRAELHERFADWLEQHGGELVELDELLGYHLEQALPLPRRARAARRRAPRARRARGDAARRRRLPRHARGDLGAAANLLGRAAALLPAESRERIEVVLALVEPLAASCGWRRSRRSSSRRVGPRSSSATSASSRG